MRVVGRALTIRQTWTDLTQKGVPQLSSYDSPMRTLKYPLNKGVRVARLHSTPTTPADVNDADDDDDGDNASSSRGGIPTNERW